MTDLSLSRTFILFLISVGYLVGGCLTGKFNHEEKEFKRYLKETFNRDPVNDGRNVFYYVLNMKECQGCINQHFAAIRSVRFNENTVLIVVGRVAKKEWQEILTEVVNRGDKVLFDERGEGLLYDFGLVKPIIMKFESGRLVDVISVEDNEVQSVVLNL